MTNFLYCLALLHPLLAIAGIVCGGIWVYSTIILSLLVYPAIEIIQYHFRIKMPVHMNKFTWFPKIAIYMAAFFVFVSLIVLVLDSAYGDHKNKFIWFLNCYSVGLSTGTVGITIAHELIHRNKFLDRNLGLCLLLISGYPWFFIQHIQGHHVNVATAKDCSTAKFNQNVYSFYLASISGGIKNVMKNIYSSLASRAATGRRKFNASLVSLSYVVLMLAVSVWIYLSLGWLALLAFSTQALIAIFILETINYIQHYGLEKKDVNARVMHDATWDCSSVTNFAIFNLGLHADHHSHPGKRYYELKSSTLSRQMPLGYFSMAFIALIPPLWFSVMNKRCAEKVNDVSFL